MVDESAIAYEMGFQDGYNAGGAGKGADVIPSDSNHEVAMADQENFTAGFAAGYASQSKVINYDGESYSSGFSAGYDQAVTGQSAAPPFTGPASYTAGFSDGFDSGTNDRAALAPDAKSGTTLDKLVATVTAATQITKDLVTIYDELGHVIGYGKPNDQIGKAASLDAAKKKGARNVSSAMMIGAAALGLALLYVATRKKG